MTTRPFIDALRPICEIIFDLLLSGYISSLKTYLPYNHSVNKSTRAGQPRQSLDKWEEAMQAAVRASQDFRDAEIKRQAQLTNEADLIVEEAMISLKYRYGIPTFSSIISNHLSSKIVWMQFRSFTNQSWLWVVGMRRRLKKYESSCMWFSFNFGLLVLHKAIMVVKNKCHRLVLNEGALQNGYSII